MGASGGVCFNDAVPMADVKDSDLLTGLYRTYGGRVYARCFALLKNKEEAQDAMHEVFIKVGKNLDGFRGDASPLTWMTRIATNHCLNVLRGKKAPWHDKYRQEVENAAVDVDGAFQLGEQRELLRLCLARVVAIDPQLAELATYAFVDDMRQSDICILVGLSAPTLRKRLREFIALCRDELTTHVPGITFAEAPI